MEARTVCAALLAASLASMGASYRSQNFVTQAPTSEMAHAIGETAERYRRELAIDWLGKEMPAWSQPCPIKANVAPNLGAGGATSFLFDRGEVYGWKMDIQGSLERILDSVLPHEVTHTIFACHFRQAVPRWADEGACTTVEHVSEREKQERMLIEFLQTKRGIPFSQMFAMKEYPRDVLPLYSQGHSLARFLLADGGKTKFLDFLANGMQDENWPRAVRQHYGYGNLASLQSEWLEWVRRGSPPLESQQPDTLVAQHTPGRRRTAPKSIYRGQSADTPLVAKGRTGRRSKGAVASTKSEREAHDIDSLEPVRLPKRRSQPPASAARPYPNHLTRPVARSTASAIDHPPGIMTWPADPPETSTTHDLSDRVAGRREPVPETSAATPRPSTPPPKREVVLEWSRPPEGHRPIRAAANSRHDAIRR
ncbi:MAG: hypothetical protein ACC645_05420 [Pirellulales bacterium]